MSVSAISASCQMDASAVNQRDETRQTFPNMHCPELPGDTNFWQASCLAKTSGGQPCCRKLCATGDAVRAAHGLPPVTTLSAILARRQDEEQKAKQTGACKCGHPAMRKRFQEKLTAEYGTTEPLCKNCARRVRERAYYQNKLAALDGEK